MWAHTAPSTDGALPGAHWHGHRSGACVAAPHAWPVVLSSPDHPLVRRHCALEDPSPGQDDAPRGAASGTRGTDLEHCIPRH
eukprot:2992490-Prymnesium_polylepis.2